MAGRGRRGRAARSRLRRHVAEDDHPDGEDVHNNRHGDRDRAGSGPADTGYLDPATLAQALVAGYNRVPPLWATLSPEPAS